MRTGNPRHPQSPYIEPTMKAQNPEPRLLRAQIQVKHKNVINISTTKFWGEHEQRTEEYVASQKKELLHNDSEIAVVALLSGSLDRDKMYKKSCVLCVP